MGGNITPPKTQARRPYSPKADLDDSRPMTREVPEDQRPQSPQSPQAVVVDMLMAERKGEGGEGLQDEQSVVSLASLEGSLLY